MQSLICTFPLIISLLSNNVYTKTSEPSVIIIGAGAAGISAATRLYQNGIENITILEAENRIGGRIYSVKFGDAYVDLGAQYCHGEKNNIVYSLVRDLNILDPGSDEFPRIYHSQLKLLNDSFTDQIIELIESINAEQKHGYNNTLGEYVIEKFNESIIEIWGNDSEKLNLANQFVGLAQKWLLAYEGAFSWFDVSTDNDFEESEGNQHLEWNGKGYKTILDVLMQNYPDSKNPIPIVDKTLLNKEVNEIFWDTNGDTAVVACKDGFNYSADHIIFTPSLGVLKDRFKSLFQPSLPIDKIKAIEQIGIGAVIKIFLLFPHKWWSASDFEGFAFVWTEADLVKTAEAFPDGPKKNGKSWISSIMAIVPADANPNMLLAWFTGEFVPEIELCSDKTVTDGIMYLLHEFGQFTNISQPDEIMRNNWFSNPHFRGTYTYQTLESRKDNVSKEVVLSKPLTTKTGKQILLFAGEATNPIHYSTVHGAIETGYREADRLIQLYK